MQERNDLWPPCLDGCGQALQFGKVGVGASAAEPVQQIADLFPVRAGLGGSGRVRAVADRSRRSSLAFHATVIGALITVAQVGQLVEESVDVLAAHPGGGAGEPVTQFPRTRRDPADRRLEDRAHVDRDVLDHVASGLVAIGRPASR
ncbi:hypothetical protein ACWD4O_42145 [Streptomyces sp. NPDC002623]